MPEGPGKYGANAEELLKKIGGSLCLVVILEGPQGASFDVATTNPVAMALLPQMLRGMAEQIEGDLKRRQN